MEDLIKLIVDNGISVFCVAYMIYFQMTIMKEMTQNMTKINETLVSMNERLNNIEDKIEK